ncbi:MAG: HNH endonuclease [Nitrospirae bacterium]|nr:HNH endonuclease [Nitrospirota bacterium]
MNNDGRHLISYVWISIVVGTIISVFAKNADIWLPIVFVTYLFMIFIGEKILGINENHKPYLDTKLDTKTIVTESQPTQNIDFTKPHPTEHKNKNYTYYEYLKSPEWKALRLQALQRANFKCQRCASTNNLQGHHVRYPKVYRNDHIDNIMIVCRQCHEKKHGIRI